jgi:hypothetical protein
VPPNIFDDVELPADEDGASAAGEAAAGAVTPPTLVPSAPASHLTPAHLSPGSVVRVAEAVAARMTPLMMRTHSAILQGIIQGTAEVKSDVKASAAEVKAEVKAEGKGLGYFERQIARLSAVSATQVEPGLKFRVHEENVGGRTSYP